MSSEVGVAKSGNVISDESFQALRKANLEIKDLKEAVVSERDARAQDREALVTTMQGMTTAIREVKTQQREDREHADRQFALVLGAIRTLGDGVLALEQSLVSKEQIDQQRDHAWKDELDAVAAQAAKNTVELIREDESAREKLDSLHESMVKVEVQAETGMQVATRALKLSALRILPIMFAGIALYRALAWLWVRGILTP